MKLSWRGSSPNIAQTAEAKKKRSKTLAKTMEKRRKEKNAWYCQCCSEKRYSDKPRFVVCEKCFKKLRELSGK